MDMVEFVTKMKETQEKPERDPRTGLKTGHYKIQEKPKRDSSLRRLRSE
jgi:hypothetical protein